MIRNQKGFTFPLTLSILITFLIFFSVRVEQLLVEQKTFHETSIILQQEYYMNASVKKLEKILQTEDPLPANGKIQYKFACMDYRVDSATPPTLKITFTLHLNTGETSRGFGYYDTGTGKMVKWVERN